MNMLFLITFLSGVAFSALADEGHKNSPDSDWEKVVSSEKGQPPLPSDKNRLEAVSYGADSSEGGYNEQWTNVCDTPAGVNILHVPVSSWTETAESIKFKQEMFNKVKKNTQQAIDVVRSFFPTEDNNNTNPADTTEDNNNKNGQSVAVKIVEKRAYAHFQLIKIIKAHPQAMVFHEFTSQIEDSRMVNQFKFRALNLGSASLSTVEKPDQLPEMEYRNQEHLFQLVNSQFPDKVIPPSFHELSKEQKETLAIVGGAHILFFLSQLPVIFPALPYLQYGDLLQKLNFSEKDIQMCEPLNVAQVCPPLSEEIPTESFVRSFKARVLANTVKTFVQNFDLGFSETIEEQLSRQYGTSVAETMKPAFSEESLSQIVVQKNPAVIMVYGGEIESDSLFEDSGYEHGDYYAQGDYDNPTQLEQALNNTSNKDLKSYFLPEDNFYRLPLSCLNQTGVGK